MISIPTVIQYIHKYKTQTNTNAGGLCRLRYERFINFLTLAHSDRRRETQFLKAYANHTSWLHLHARRILWCLRSLSVEIRKSQLHLSTVKIQLSATMAETQLSISMVQSQLLNWLFFKILKFSGTSLPGKTSSTFQLHFLSGGLLWQWWLSYLLRARVKLHPMTMHLNS